MDGDGDVDAADISAIPGGGYVADLDADNDGSNADDTSGWLIPRVSGGLYATAVPGGWLSDPGLGSTVGTDNSIGYAGYVADFETGDYHVRNRRLDPATGRWFQRDPLEYAGGSSNVFEYVVSRPLTHTDPQGLSAVPLPANPPASKPPLRLVRPPAPIPPSPAAATAAAAYACVLVAQQCYYIGEQISPRVFPPINPNVPSTRPGTRQKPCEKDRCKDAINRKNKYCRTKFSADHLPYGVKNAEDCHQLSRKKRKLVQDLSRRFLLRASLCRKAREDVIRHCFHGVTDDNHQIALDNARRAEKRMRKIRQACSSGV